MANFIFSEEVVQVMRAFERVSKSIWELKNKLNSYYPYEPFYVEFNDDRGENVLVLGADNLTIFFYYYEPAQGEHMKQSNFKVAYLR